MKNKIKDFFYFNRSEQSGILFLIALILILLSTIILIPHFTQKQPQDFTEIEKEIQSLIQAKQPNSPHKEPEILEKSENFQKFYFNPNHASKDELKNLGIPEKLIKTVINYREKGGKFKTKNDLKKIYGFPDSLFRELEPYLMTEKEMVTQKKEASDSLYTHQKIFQAELTEINTADSIDLIQIKGIGSYTAGKILYYRKKWNGFYSLEQLYEIQGLKKENVDTFIDKLTLNTSSIKKIDINTVSHDELKNLYGINWNTVNAILAYRKQHGKYKTTNEIMNTGIIDSITYKKLENYITVSND